MNIIESSRPPVIEYTGSMVSSHELTINKWGDSFFFQWVQRCVNRRQLKIMGTSWCLVLVAFPLGCWMMFTGQTSGDHQIHVKLWCRWSGFAVKKLEMSHDPLWKYGCEPTHGSVLTRTVEIMIWRHISSYLIYVYIYIYYIFLLNPSITYPLSRYLYDNIYLTLTFEMPIP